MKTNLTTLVASLPFLLSAACSAPPPDVAGAASSDEAASVVDSAPLAPYVLLERDATSASGYVITTLNSGATSHVATLDLSAVGLDVATLAPALATPATIAARGTTRGGDTFVASDLDRALPAPNAASQATYYLAHAGARGADSAAEVNLGKARTFHGLDLSAAETDHVDERWLTARVLDGDALVAGSIATGVLHASAVFVRVPEKVTCSGRAETCEPGTVATYERDARRCLVATGCAHHAMCPMYIAACAPGYTRATWPGPRGCPAFACDPDFDPAP